MALSSSERIRLNELEETINQLAQLVKGGGSVNQLNRLLVLAQDKIVKLSDQVTEMEDTVETLLDLVRKLQ